MLWLINRSQVHTPNWEKHKDVDALPNFKFPVSTAAFNSIIYDFSKKVQTGE
ncbi:hypothetical protein C5S39_01295 [Candidatus Methanophagaceae archaeon]|nr:hypothetical protein C5S39_01295 [Methanophagales archaeon]